MLPLRAKKRNATEKSDKRLRKRHISGLCIGGQEVSFSGALIFSGDSVASR
jgi:hypothetical protein